MFVTTYYNSHYSTHTSPMFLSGNYKKLLSRTIRMQHCLCFINQSYTNRQLGYILPS